MITTVILIIIIMNNEIMIIIIIVIIMITVIMMTAKSRSPRRATCTPAPCPGAVARAKQHTHHS